MSLSAIVSLPPASSSLSALPLAAPVPVSSLSVAGTASTTEAAQIAIHETTSADPSVASKPPGLIEEDFKHLLKALAAGDSAGAKAALGKLDQDIKTNEEVESDSQPANPDLGTALTQVANSLNAGSTENALKALESYLAQNEPSAGTVLDTSA